MKRKHLSLLTALLLCLSLLAGCGSGSKSLYVTDVASAEASAAPQTANMATGGFDMRQTADYDMVEYEEEMGLMVEEPAEEPAPIEPELPADDSGGEVAYTPETQRKIVTTYYMTLETTEYDSAVAHLTGVAEGYGGYIEHSSVGGRSVHNENAARYASFVLRIPTEKMREFLDGLDERYNVINSEESSSDITNSYYDSTARLKSLEEQRDRLVKLREENSEGADLEYLLQIEQEISEVNYKIESLYSQIQRMDNSVNLSTVHIQLNEVMTYQPVETMPQSFGERLGKALSNAWRNFVTSAQDSIINIIWSAPYFIVNLFWFLIFVAILLLIVRFVRRRLKRIRAKRAEQGSPDNISPEDNATELPDKTEDSSEK